MRLRNEGFTNDQVMHRIERDLDLEGTRLDLPANAEAESRPLDAVPRE